MIRSVTDKDVPSVCSIYNYYIKTSTATFEEEELSEDEVSRRIKEVLLKHVWLVYETGNRIAGYAYASSWKLRHAYRYSAESTVYVEKDFFGKGIGNELMVKLLEEMKKKNFHYILAGIALPNDASIRLHEKLGFEKCGQLNEVGFKFGKWIDVGYWQKII